MPKIRNLDHRERVIGNSMKRPLALKANSQRLDRVMRYIHENLQADLDLLQLADVACLSPFHFHRLYHTVTGETVAATLARLRLHGAAIALTKTDRPLAAIARGAHYGSISAFSRAFSASHGETPTRFRAKARASGVHSMTKITIQHRPALRLLVTEHLGAAHRIGEAFDRLVAWGAPRGLLGPGRVGVAVYLTDMSLPEAEQRALAGFTIEGDVASGDPRIMPYDIAAGRHVVALHKGPYAQIGKTWRAVYAWVAANEREPANRPAFEVNLNNPRYTPPEELLTEVCVPLAD
jgi:AraC family transcriptional regulator